MGFIVLGVVLVAVLVWLAVQASRWAAARSQVDHTLASPAAATLDYVVPEGQDPAVVLAALHDNGVQAAPDVGARQLVHVACPPTSNGERERVRSIIEGIHRSGIDAGAPFDAGAVRFEDERSSGLG
jgi:hypothetical protein